MSGNVLVIGGAGYIGSHTCLALHKAGMSPIVFDNLSNGHKDAVKWGEFHQGDIRYIDRLRDVCTEVKPIGIIHFAGLIEVGESVEKPLDYYNVNVRGSMNVVQVSQEQGIRNIVFSSTCATFGAPVSIPMNETHPQQPLNPYGQTKLVVEKMLSDIGSAGGPSFVGLRYFNAAGAAYQEGIGERHDPETHAIPLILRSIASGTQFGIFGADYPTRDGTCIRDYIHVSDLADAHVRALNYLLNGGKSDFFNLGTGQGTSVQELLNTISKELDTKIKTVIQPRRAGDAPELIADSTKAEKTLGWVPKHDISEIIRSAAKWHKLI